MFIFQWQRKSSARPMSEQAAPPKESKYFCLKTKHHQSYSWTGKQLFLWTHYLVPHFFFSKVFSVVVQICGYLLYFCKPRKHCRLKSIIESIKCKVLWLLTMFFFSSSLNIIGFKWSFGMTKNILKVYSNVRSTQLYTICSNIQSEVNKSSMNNN